MSSIRDSAKSINNYLTNRMKAITHQPMNAYVCTLHFPVYSKINFDNFQSMQSIEAKNTVL